MQNNTSTEQGTLSNNQAVDTIKKQASELTNRIPDIKHLPMTLTCSIRRKSGLIGVPGQDPSERMYRVGSSFEIQSKKSLKGVSGELENLLMPEIVGANNNAYEFRRMVDEYWKNISVPIPADDDTIPEHERGYVCKIKFTLKRESHKKQFEALTTLQEKIEFIQRGLVGKIDTADGKVSTIDLDYECIADFLLLSYCLKYSKVANNVTDVANSGKILFYLFEKSAALNTKFNIIRLKEEASKIFSTVQDDEKQINALLLEFGKDPHAYEDLMEKVIILDEEYSKNANTLTKFIKLAGDENWETRYLIKLATKQGKLHNPANSTVYYYNSIMLGKTLEDTVLYLNNGTEDATTIKNTLSQEVNLTNKMTTYN